MTISRKPVRGITRPTTTAATEEETASATAVRPSATDSATVAASSTPVASASATVASASAPVASGGTKVTAASTPVASDPAASASATVAAASAAAAAANAVTSPTTSTAPAVGAGTSTLGTIPVASETLADVQVNRDLSGVISAAEAANLRNVQSAIAALSTEVPLALLPLRLSTRYAFNDDQVSLRVRIFPDALHTPATLSALSADEIALAKSFWQAACVDDSAAQLEAFRTLCEDFGQPWRAAYAARACRPSNWASPPPSRPIFRDPAAPAATARLLPDRFVVMGWVGNKMVLEPKVGAKIPADLRIVPEVEAPSIADGASGWLAAQGLGWMEDYDEAVRVGMGITVNVTGSEAAQGVDQLLVLGIHSAADPNLEADGLESLLAAHSAQHGVALLPTGTPTNNTGDGRSGYSSSSPRLQELLAEVMWVSGDTPAATDLRKGLGLTAGSLLHRSTGGAEDPDGMARAMNGALWPAGLGWLLRIGLPLGLAETDIAATRDHFINWVRGGGRFAALRAGESPYGVLPIRKDAAGGNSFVDRLGALLDKLQPTWQDGVSAVPRMDPDAADQPATGAVQPDAISRVTSVLSAVPNPVRFALRLVENQQNLYQFQYGLFTLFIDAGYGTGDPIETTLAAELGAAKDIEGEIAAWKKALASTKTAIRTASATTKPKLEAVRDLIEDYVLPLLEAHVDRMEPVLSLGVNRSTVNGKLSSSFSPLFFAFYEADAVDWKGPIAPNDPAASFAALLAQLNGGAVASESPPSLLFTLLQRSISKVHANDKAALVTALTSLVSLAATRRPRDFTLAMRESLGAMMYRLDAWQSSIAARTLDEKRSRRARGLHLGAWGVVLDLKMRTKVGGISQGYLHAPSLAQSVTGAVLRSGWSALGSDGQTSPLSVDLSSDRVRRAEDILDAIRAGEAMSVLLGQRLERRLHDVGLDRLIEPLRDLATATRGPQIGPRGAAAPVDGQAIARAWSGGDSFAPLSAAETALKTQLTALVGTVSLSSDGWALPPRSRFTAALDDGLADLDAVADLLIAEGVHNLLQGNNARASAALSTLGRGELPPPELWMPRSDRGGVSVTHRLALVLPATLRASAAWPGAASSPAAAAEPRLEAWVADRMGSPADVGFVVLRGDKRVTMRLYSSAVAETAIGALDFLRLADDGHDLDRYVLELAARMYPDEVLGLDTTDAAGAKRSLDELALAARALRHALHGARALRPTSLVTPDSSATDTFDLAELSARVTSARSALTAARSALSMAIDAVNRGASEASLRPQLVLCQARGLPTGAETRLERAQRALAELDRRLALPTPESSLSSLTEALHGLVGRKLPILPVFTATDGAALDASATRGGGGEAMAWLGQVAKVREGAGALAEAIDLVEAVRDDAVMSEVRVAQLPDDGGAWAATSAPPDDRLSLWILGPKTASFTAPTCGLLFDSWQETVPGSTQTTGVAVHLDAPGAQAPQVVLLGLAPGSEAWDLDSLAAMAKDAVGQAKRRMVSTENLPSVGQYLPGVALSDSAGAS